MELETDKFIKKIRDKYKDELEAEAKDEVKTEVAIRIVGTDKKDKRRTVVVK